MDMHGKVAVVTGGARGIGKGLAEALLKRGAKVCIADIKVQTGEATVTYFQRKYGSDRAMFVKCDVSVQADVKGVFDRVRRQYGRLDILVNDAAICNEEQFNKMVDINVKGVIMGTQLGVEMMRKDTGGNGGIIINIASVAGISPVFTLPAYTGTKYAVVGFTRSWAENPYMKTLGVRFACLCPAFTNTEIMMEELEQESVEYREQTDKMMETVGVMEVSQVVSAFEELLDMSDNNGIVMTVTKKTGVKIRHRGSRL